MAIDRRRGGQLVKIKYLAQRGWREINDNAPWHFKVWKAYLLAGLEAFAGA